MISGILWKKDAHYIQEKPLMNKQSFLFSQSLLFALLALTAGCSISRSGMFENEADIGTAIR
jgi:hypothetical protein